MRWSDYLATLPAAEQMRLVNWLTLGFGQLNLAVRLGTQNVPVGAVLGALAAAADLLHGSRMLLPGMATAAPVESTLIVPVVGWQPFLLGLAMADRAALLDGLTQVVQQARQAGELLLTDQVVTAVAAQLAHVAAGLADSRQYLLSLVRRYAATAD